jgi:hypothetical protein
MEKGSTTLKSRGTYFGVHGAEGNGWSDGGKKDEDRDRNRLLVKVSHLFVPPSSNRPLEVRSNSTATVTEHGRSVVIVMFEKVHCLGVVVELEDFGVRHRLVISLPGSHGCDSFLSL